MSNDHRWGSDEYRLNHQEFCLSRLFPFQDDWMVQNSHYSTCFSWSNIQFFVLPSIICKCDSKTLELRHMLLWYSPNVQRASDRILERCRTSDLEVLIFIPAMSHAAAKLFNACLRPDSEKTSRTKLSAKSNRLILHPRSWLTHWFGWACPSSLCKLWKGEVTKHSLAEYQHSNEIRS